MNGHAQRWAVRLLLGLTVGVGTWLGTADSGLHPRAVPLVLLVVVGVAVGGLVVDAVSTSGVTTWAQRPSVDPRTRSRDPRTSSHLHALEAHLAAREPDDQLATRLLALADLRLRTCREVGIDSEQGRHLLGADLDRLRSAPVRRLGPADVDRLLSRIERI